MSVESEHRNRVQIEKESLMSRDEKVHLKCGRKYKIIGENSENFKREGRKYEKK